MFDFEESQMKICLIPYPVVKDSPDNPDYHQMFPYLPLGLLTLAALLEKSGHRVSIIDPAMQADMGLIAGSELLNPEKIASLIQDESPDLVGFSTIFCSYPLVLEWAKSFHTLSPDIPILLGGPQASATDRLTLQAFPWINFILRGEAENSLIPLISSLETGSSLASVPGLTWRSEDQIIRNPDAPVVMDLDTLPVPAYHLYPMEQLIQSYRARAGRFYHQPFPLEAGRGCPFNCSFCAISGFFHRRYRTKSVERLVHEMISLHNNYGLEHFDLAHDLFTCNKEYISQFCDHLREKDPEGKLKWDCYSRINTVDKDILTRMAAAGCSGIFYGIETGSPRMQKLLRKNLPVQRVMSVVRDSLDLGMHVTVSFILGFPQEQKDDFIATVDMALEMVRMGVHSVQFYPLSPLPGSELYHTYVATLQHDGQWSDLSNRCLTEKEKLLIAAWPAIFSGFYHYDIPHLDYNILRAFIMIFNRYPRLLVALSSRGANIISVFEDWAGWYRSCTPGLTEYYFRQNKFFLDFFEFLNHYLSKIQILTPDLADIIRFHIVTERVSLAPDDSPIVSEKFSSDVMVLISNLVEGKPLSEDILKPANYLFWKLDGKLIIKRSTPTLEKLLNISQP